VEINNGHAYFVPTEPYNAYVKKVPVEDDVRWPLHLEGNTLIDHVQKSTCAHLKAVRMQNLSKFKNTSVSGVVAVQCSRHMFYQPAGTVDLEKGEAYVLPTSPSLSISCFCRYARSDYAAFHALRELILLRWIMISYDIWCQYSKKMHARITKWLPHLAGVLSKIRGAIPSMHVKNHKDLCQKFYSFGYLRYSGCTHGEGIEGGWAENNLSAGTTKQQNAGHRHDTLDDFFGYWNWNKLQNLRKSCFS